MTVILNDNNIFLFALYFHDKQFNLKIGFLI